MRRSGRTHYFARRCTFTPSFKNCRKFARKESRGVPRDSKRNANSVNNVNIKRLFSIGSACLMSALSAGACSSGEVPNAAAGNTAGASGNSVVGTGGSSGTTPLQTGGGSAAAVAGSSSSSAGASAVGGFAGSVATNGGGGVTSSGGFGGAGGTAMAPVPCTDKQTPDHAGESCNIWPVYDEAKGANEAKDCDASWLTGSGYCLKSCGKCTDGSGGSGNGGSGGGYSTGLGPGPALPDVTNGNIYWASRYWDCCKPHCSQNGLPSCGSDGVSQNSGNSACSGGSAYACYNQAPRAVGDLVSYGYVAVPNPSCGTCYHLQFTGTGKFNANDIGSKSLAGKHMIVKVANTGGDVAGNQFDLAVPGGGVGINANTCTAQWKLSSSDLGPTAGGFLTACTGTHDQKMSCVRDKCNKLPDGNARKGCLWFVDWFQVADDPNFRYEPIACPSDI